MNSWGGNPSTRYNYEIGHAWNHGADYEFRNTNYGDPGDDSARDFARRQRRRRRRRRAWPCRRSAGSPRTTTRTTARSPTAPAAACRRATSATARTRRTGRRPDPRQRREHARAGRRVDRAAWSPTAPSPSSSRWTTSPSCGATPTTTSTRTCPTYEEILDKYLTYAAAVRDVAPDAALAGPVHVLLVRLLATSRPGPADGGGRGLPGWFLAQRAGRTTTTPAAHARLSRRALLPAERRLQRRRRRRDERPPAAQHALAVGPDYNDESWIDTTDPVHPADAGDHRAEPTRARRSSSRSGTSAPTARSTAPWRSPTCSASTAARASTPPPTGATRRSAARAASPSRCTATTTAQGSRFGGDVVAGDDRATRDRSAPTPRSTRRRRAARDADQQGPRSRRRRRPGDRRARRGHDGSDVLLRSPTSAASIVAGTADLRAAVVVPASSIIVLELDLA